MSMGVTRDPDRPVRALHLVGPMNRGGVESWLMTLLRHADRRVLALDLLTTAEQPAAYDEEIRSLGARLLRLPPASPLSYRSKLLGLLRAYGPYDAVHSHLHFFSGWPLLAARQAEVPVRAITSHIDSRSLDRQASRLRHVYHAAARQLILRSANRKMAVSPEAAAALYGDGWMRRGVTIERLGLDLSALRTLSARDETLRELGLPTDEPVLLSVGRLDKAKNHLFLLDVFAAFLAHHGRGQLLLAGEGPERKHIERRRAERGLTERVHLLGSRPDVPRLLHAADVFILPSLYEGLALALVEAQVVGLPCVIAGQLTPASRLPGAFYRTPFLTDDLSVWVDALNQALAAGRRPGDGSAFDVRTNIQSLLKVYRA
ncbi:glycosyltransferase family 1 protein [Deinococcus sp. SDU3-2]|uniref:Glycosyltransferase family 1 protein n=1 Tax=Deinococcus terrestris TaxID=2651870 RepID=A0A7X1TT16_9DEIO|nr:glycosyltransferase [Deinococcus terrestris]MPY68380.1 glycosyltransferase family 1 protein [Deinococcus terrestris]